MKKIRNSNIELLRIIAMFMIIVYHIYCHCILTQLTDGASMARWNNGFFNQPIIYKKLYILSAIAPFGEISNSIFILISGYFMIQKKDNITIKKWLASY